jgi:hypothetical protein
MDPVSAKTLKPKGWFHPEKRRPKQCGVWIIAGANFGKES